MKKQEEKKLLNQLDEQKQQEENNEGVYSGCGVTGTNDSIRYWSGEGERGPITSSHQSGLGENRTRHRKDSTNRYGHNRC